jgi:hypothetical protein
VIGADRGEQAGPFGHLEGRAMHVGQAERDVPGPQAACQLPEHHGAGRFGGGDDGLLDGVAHQFRGDA